MTPPQAISSDELDLFQREGYLVRREFDSGDVARLRTMVAELLAARPLPNPRILAHSALTTPDSKRFPSNPYATYHLVNSVLAGDQWLSLAADPRLVDTLVSLLGTSVDLDMSFLRMRPSGLRMDAPWHRDADTDRFGSQLAATALIYLHDMTESSGATKVVPARQGYHLTSLERQNVAIEDLEDTSMAIEAPAGTVLYLSPTVVHRGGWNQTAQESGVVAFEYRAAGNRRLLDEPEDLALMDLPIARPGWRLTGPVPWTA